MLQGTCRLSQGSYAVDMEESHVPTLTEDGHPCSMQGVIIFILSVWSISVAVAEEFQTTPSRGVHAPIRSCSIALSKRWAISL